MLRDAPPSRRSACRVRLGLLTAKDETEFLGLAKASQIHHRGLLSLPVTRSRFRLYLKRSRREDFIRLMIRRRADGALLGSIEMSQIVGGPFRSAYLGYWIGGPFAREGYMTEALRLALRLAFTRMKLHRLEANIQPKNAASIALVRRLGFTREGYSRRYLKIAGRWRDHERWAILAEDWREAAATGAAPTGAARSGTARSERVRPGAARSATPRSRAARVSRRSRRSPSDSS